MALRVLARCASATRCRSAQLPYNALSCNAFATFSSVRPFHTSARLMAGKTKEQLEDEEEQRELEELIAEQEKKRAKSYKHDSTRAGIIAEKLGMMNIFDGWGIQQIITVVRVDNHVIHHNEAPCERTGLMSIKVGAGRRKAKKTPDWLARMCDRAECDFKLRLHDFPVTEDAVIPVGTQIHARHFNVGQYVDVQGVTRGRGFQGPMKRWGFGGQPASHGISKTHRSHGSTGATGPAKVFKGKKMAGNMGNKVKIIRNNRIYKIDTARNLLFILGTLPGAPGTFLILKDAQHKKFSGPEDAPAFPTYFPDPTIEEPVDITMEREGDDPFAYGLD